MGIKENTDQPDELSDTCFTVCILCALLLMFSIIFGIASISDYTEPDVADIKIVFMNVTTFEWNLLIRIPPYLPGSDMCLHGDFQASLLHKDIAIATTPTKRYKNLKHEWPQLLRISGVVSKEDINGAIGKVIMDDPKESVVQVAVVFSDCREKTIGMMKYVCDEVKLRYDPRSQGITTSVFGNPTTCHYDSKVVSL